MHAAQRRKRAVSGDNHQVAQLENFRLKVFRAVAEHLNFRKAAEQLFLTQPAVTLQIKALEDDLGIRLFDRTAGRVSLTSQGSVLLGHAKKIATLVSQAELELGTAGNSGCQPLRSQQARCSRIDQDHRRRVRKVWYSGQRGQSGCSTHWDAARCVWQRGGNRPDGRRTTYWPNRSTRGNR